MKTSVELERMRWLILKTIVALRKDGSGKLGVRKRELERLISAKHRALFRRIVGTLVVKGDIVAATIERRRSGIRVGIRLSSLEESSNPMLYDPRDLPRWCK